MKHDFRWIWLCGHGGCGAADFVKAVNCHPHIRLSMGSAIGELICTLALEDRIDLKYRSYVDVSSIAQGWYHSDRIPLSRLSDMLESLRPDVPYVGDASCYYANHVDELYGMFPGSVFMYITRDLDAMVKSKLRKGYFNFDPDESPSRIVEKAYEITSQQVELQHRIENRYPTIVTTLEALVRDRDDTMQQVYERLGLDMSLADLSSMPLFTPESR